MKRRRRKCYGPIVGLTWRFSAVLRRKGGIFSSHLMQTGLILRLLFGIVSLIPIQPRAIGSMVFLFFPLIWMGAWKGGCATFESNLIVAFDGHRAWLCFLQARLIFGAEAGSVHKMFLNLHGILCITWWLRWCGSYFRTDINKNCWLLPTDISVMQQENHC